MDYNKKIMRLELSAENPVHGGYYYAELLLPAADYEIKDAILTDMKSKNAELLVIPNISRLGRNTAAVAEIVKAFANEDMDIETTDGSRLSELFEPDTEPLIFRM